MQIIFGKVVQNRAGVWANFKMVPPFDTWATYLVHVTIEIRLCLRFKSVDSTELQRNHNALYKANWLRLIKNNCNWKVISAGVSARMLIKALIYVAYWLEFAKHQWKVFCFYYRVKLMRAFLIFGHWQPMSVWLELFFICQITKFIKHTTWSTTISKMCQHFKNFSFWFSDFKAKVQAVFITETWVLDLSREVF